MARVQRAAAALVSTDLEYCMSTDLECCRVLTLSTDFEYGLCTLDENCQETASVEVSVCVCVCVCVEI